MGWRRSGTFGGLGGLSLSLSLSMCQLHSTLQQRRRTITITIRRNPNEVTPQFYSVYIRFNGLVHLFVRRVETLMRMYACVRVSVCVSAYAMRSGRQRLLHTI